MVNIENEKKGKDDDDGVEDFAEEKEDMFTQLLVFPSFSIPGDNNIDHSRNHKRDQENLREGEDNRQYIDKRLDDTQKFQCIIGPNKKHEEINGFLDVL